MGEADSANKQTGVRVYGTRICTLNIGEGEEATQGSRPGVEKINSFERGYAIVENDWEVLRT